MSSVVEAPVALRVQMARDLTKGPYSVGTCRTKAWSDAAEGRVTLAKIAGRQIARTAEEVEESARTAW